MLLKINALTVTLIAILVLMVVIILGSLLDYIQLEQPQTYYGKYLILRVRNNNRSPYKAFECQYSGKLFFIRCSNIENLENSTELRGK